MAEKERIQRDVNVEQLPSPPPAKAERGRYPPHLFFLVITGCLFFLHLINTLSPCASQKTGSSASADHASYASGHGELVPLEAHIMSKCEDAQFCLRELILPAMQRVYDKVNFTLSYIGT